MIPKKLDGLPEGNSPLGSKRPSRHRVLLFWVRQASGGKWLACLRWAPTACSVIYAGLKTHLAQSLAQALTEANT
jgi:hypothetical protein